MGSIGPAEILVVLVVALIVLGPNRLPDAARSLGRAVNEVRRVTSGLQSEVREAFAEAPPSYPERPPPPSPTLAGSPDSPPPGPVPPARPGEAELAAPGEPGPPPS